MICAVAAQPSPRGAILLDAALLQATWFACVLGTAHDLTTPGLLIGTVSLGVHVFLLRDRRRSTSHGDRTSADGRTTPSAPAVAHTARILGRILAVAAVGCLGDALLVRVGALHLRGDAIPLLGLPGWMLVLWTAFAATYDLSLRGLRTRLRLAALLGLLGSPLSYLSAARLGALQLGEPLALSLALTGVVWSVSLPATLWLAARLDPARTDGGDDLDGR